MGRSPGVVPDELPPAGRGQAVAVHRTEILAIGGALGAQGADRDEAGGIIHREGCRRFTLAGRFCAAAIDGGIGGSEHALSVCDRGMSG